MPVTKRTVLVHLTDAYETTSRPQSVAGIAAALDASPDDVADVLASLEALELVTAVGEGYRPTVTAYELLELDVLEEEFVVLDVGHE